MIITADKAMVPQLKELWLCCFQDAAEDVDYFFDRRFETYFFPSSATNQLEKSSFPVKRLRNGIIISFTSE